MPSARYWRLVGCAPYERGSALSLSEIALLNGTTRVDTGATCTYAPSTGSLVNLGDNNNSTTATFDWLDIQKANFAFQWDLGSSLEVDGLRFGSAATRGGFIARATLEASSDGVFWRPVSHIQGLTFQGPNTSVVVSRFKIVTPDVVCKFDGTNGAKVVEPLVGSIAPLTFGTNVALSTTQKYSGVSSMFFPGGQTLLTQSFSAGVPFTGRFASRFFTASAWIYPTALGGFIAGSFNSQGGTTHEGWFIRTDSNGALSGMALISGFSSFGLSSVAELIALNTWHHVVIEREANVLRLYHNGQVVASRSDMPDAAIGSTQSRNLGIGCLNSNLDNTPFTGFIDDLMLTESAAVHGGFAFVPEAWDLQTGDNPSAHALEPTISLYDATSDIKLFTPQNINTQPRATAPSESRIDMIFGGRGVIAGTVKEKSLPENTPLFRKVRLIDERSGYVVAETWSDAATGNYSFANIDRSRTYTVLSYDHTGLYRAVIADRLTPELMS